MSTRIRDFPELYGLIILNSTVTSWDDPNALHRDYLRRLNMILLVHANVTASGHLPAPLVQITLPSSFQDFEISGSNLTTLPPNLDEMWPWVVALYIEFKDIGAVPASLFQLNELQYLSLASNRIQFLPNDALSSEQSPLWYLSLSGNPLRELPPYTLNHSFDLIYQLDIEYTDISELPEWIWQCSKKRGDFELSAFGSPFCKELAINATAVKSWDSRLCSTDHGTREGTLPVGVITKLHPVV